ncbi:hypothetical protein EDB85DRAFT_2031623, partial [Lactarius pseudohatsudake]
MPLILYPLTLLARFAFVCHYPKEHCFISRCIVLSGSLFGLLGRVHRVLSKEAWEPSELKASHWLMFVAELPSCT